MILSSGPVSAVLVYTCSLVYHMPRRESSYLNSLLVVRVPYSNQAFCRVRCTKIINADSEDPKYIINVKQFAKFVVDLSDQVAPTDIEEGMRVG